MHDAFTGLERQRRGGGYALVVVVELVEEKLPELVCVLLLEPRKQSVSVPRGGKQVGKAKTLGGRRGEELLEGGVNQTG